MLRQELVALLARVEQFLNQHGSSTPLQLPDLRQSPTDCEVRLDTALKPQSVGEIPILLLSLDGGFPYCEGLFVFHWNGQVWQHQVIAQDRLPGDPAAIAAAQQANGGRLELGVAWNQCVHCSVNFAWYALLRLVNGQWMALWRALDQSVWRGAHGSLAFEDGLKRFSVQYSDWSAPDKKLRPDGRTIFAAANGGPHRWFVDSWQREGDGYRPARTVSLPSTYKTAVEFVYALMQKDDAAATGWTTGPSLVSRARELQLDRLPVPAFADPDDTLGTVTIWRNEARYVVLRMTRPGQEWLIASIEQLP